MRETGDREREISIFHSFLEKFVFLCRYPQPLSLPPLQVTHIEFFLFLFLKSVEFAANLELLDLFKPIRWRFSL